MHELSLAMNIVDIAEREARKANASIVESITLEIGQCAGIEKSSFDFAWPMAVKGSVLENAVLNLEKIKGKSKCGFCNNIFDIEQKFDPCPQCGSFNNKLLSGGQFRIKSITII